MSTHPRLGERLLSRGCLNEDQLRIGLMEQHRLGMPLGDTLLHLDFARDEDILQVLSEQLELPTIEASELIPQAGCRHILPASLIRNEQVLPIRTEQLATGQTTLWCATDQPDDLLKLDRIRGALPVGHLLQPVLANPAALAEAIQIYFPAETLIEHWLSDLEHNQHHPGNTVVDAVDSLLKEAIEQRASDIHCEPEQHCLRIRLRIDGHLLTHRILHLHAWPAILVRLKILADLDISETRHPQDGRMTLEHAGRTIDMRVSSMPTLHGENLVLRLLDRDKGILPLHTLGLDTQRLALLQHCLARPEGLLLMTGPTGSGKTTTLYALLQQLADQQLNIMTLEDPVEYALPGIRQTAIDPPRLDFAAGIRAMLRQDPDVLLIGEIRDEETAAMALRAAQTGHRVFSTLHAADPFAALPRLAQLGLPLTALNGNLNAIVAQRLVRKLCSACAIPIDPTPTMLARLGAQPSERPPQLKAPHGCPACQGIGYRGRIPLIEILPFNPATASLLDNSAVDYHTGRALARAHGWKSLAEHGCEHVWAGTTSLAELQTVVLLPPSPT